MIGAVTAAVLTTASVVFLHAAATRRTDVPVAGGSAANGIGGVVRSARPVPRRTLVLLSGTVGAFAGAFVAGPPGLVGGGVAGLGVPIGLERRRRSQAASRIEEQLLDAVTSIAASLRAGRSLVQSLGAAGDDVGAPLGPVLEEAAGRVALGIEIDHVLDDVATRIGGDDARLVIGVLRLHRRTGGTLASALDDLALTLRARRDAARELRSLTAQARLSATILGLLPLGFFLFLSIVARGDVEGAYRSTAGASAIGLGLVLQGAAFVWIRRLLRVEDT